MFVFFPAGLGIDAEEIRKLRGLSFTPKSLSESIGFKTGYFPAQDMIEKWKRGEMTVNDFLPQLGGMNEFKIGSDTLSSEELERVAAKITKGIQEE